MPQDPTEFVREVMKALGCENPRQLALKLWPGNVDAPKRANNWLKPGNAPNYEATMLMLERTGRLRQPARRTRRPASPRAEDATREAIEAIRQLDQILTRLLEADSPPGSEQEAEGT